MAVQKSSNLRSLRGFAVRALIATTLGLGVALLLVVGSCGRGPVKRRSVDVTFDAATLGTAGGSLCNALRSYLTATVEFTARAAASDDSDRRALAKEFFQRAERTTAELEKLAPADLKAVFRSQHNGSVALLRALKQVNFEVMHLDAKTLGAIADLDLIGTSSDDAFDQYVRHTCGIDFAAFSRSVKVVQQ